jgi:hypothetical protein
VIGTVSADVAGAVGGAGVIRECGGVTAPRGTNELKRRGQEPVRSMKRRGEKNE